MPPLPTQHATVLTPKGGVVLIFGAKFLGKGLAAGNAGIGQKPLALTLLFGH